MRRWGLRSGVARAWTWLTVGQAQIGVALLVGTVLRLAWVAFATRTPASIFSDSAQYLAVARQLAAGHGPSLGGEPTAVFAPGYSIVLVPFAWLERLFGTSTMVHAAALLNVAFGAATISLTARLAGIWGSPRSAAWAAWLLAVAPGQIFFTSTILSETAFAAGVVAIVCICSRWSHLDRSSLPSIGSFVAMGAAIGFLVVVRNVGLLLLLLPPLLLWRHGTRPAQLRRLGGLVLGSALVLVPISVLNGTAVGSWSPLFTGGASSVCLSHQDGATGLPDFSARAQVVCYRGSPWDRAVLYRKLGQVDVNVPRSAVPTGRGSSTRHDEVPWMRRRTRAAVSWAFHHPRQEAVMTARKVHVILGQDGDALTMAEDGGVQPLPSSQVRALLQALADLWWWTVLVLAGVSLVRLRSCRAAWVLWLTPILFLVLSLPGVALDRYHHPMAPFLTCLAACALASARPAGSWSPSGEERSGAAGSAREDLVDVST